MIGISKLTNKLINSITNYTIPFKSIEKLLYPYFVVTLLLYCVINIIFVKSIQMVLIRNIILVMWFVIQCIIIFCIRIPKEEYIKSKIKYLKVIGFLTLLLVIALLDYLFNYQNIVNNSPLYPKETPKIREEVYNKNMEVVRDIEQELQSKDGLTYSEKNYYQYQLTGSFNPKSSYGLREINKSELWLEQEVIKLVEVAYGISNYESQGVSNESNKKAYMNTYDKIMEYIELNYKGK